MSEGGSRLVAAQPSLMGVASSRSVVSTEVAVMAVTHVVSAEVGSGVNLAVPPPPIAEEERREAGLPVLPDGGAHSSHAWSELEGAEETWLG